MEKKLFPDRVTVELTNDCNVSCSFCNRQKIKMDIGYISDDLYYKIIDEMSLHLPIKLVPFFRGEPLMHPHFIDYMKYAKEKGIGPIQIASNALLLNDDMQDKIIQAGVDYISFSLDTLDTDLYKCTRKYGDLQISSKNVEQFGNKCKELRKKGIKTPTLQVSTINLKEYIPGQKDFIDKWLKYVDVVRAYEEHDDKGRLVDPKVREKFDVFSDRKPCRKIFTDMIIYWDGKTALCNYDWDEDEVLGDISQSSIETVWNSDKYENIRKMHNLNNINKDICKECNHWKIDYTENGFLGQSYHSTN